MVVARLKLSLYSGMFVSEKHYTIGGDDTPAFVLKSDPLVKVEIVPPKRSTFEDIFSIRMMA